MSEPLKSIVARVAILNLSYFAIEFYFAQRFNSVALFSDSLDFLEDASVNILIFLSFSLAVIWRARLSYIFAFLLLLPGCSFLYNALQQIANPITPSGDGMSIVGLGALGVNIYCAIILNKFKEIKGGLAKAAYFSARNDAIANILIIIAGIVTLFWLSAIPDLIVGSMIFLMNADSARAILKAANREHKDSKN
ncbi:MAG: cation transporter [Candidatus Nanopelagicaceae bacterium]